MKEEETDKTERILAQTDSGATGGTMPQETEADAAAGGTKPQEAEASSKTKLLSSLVSEDEDGKPEVMHVKDVMRAFSINGMWFRRQIGAFALVLLGIILYITNGYQAQQEMIEEERLRAELQDKKFRSITRNSELTFRCRQSQLEERLRNMGDSTLLPSSEPLYKITGHK